MSKPRVHTRCVANDHAGPTERIVEFGAGKAGTGGLISFLMTDDGRLLVQLYQLSGKLEVTVGDVS